jgi:putative peptidoglycan lipid II flippase
LNVVLSLVLSALFQTWGWMPHGGLALANSLATAFESGILLWLLRKRLGGLGLAGSGRAFVTMAGGGAAMALALWGWMQLLPNASVLTIGLGGIALGSVVYLLTAAVFRLDELQLVTELLGNIRRRSNS